MAYTGINKSSEHFETLIYSGNASNPRTLSGLDFQPDWVWLKNRTDSNGHTLADSIRGSNVSISSDSTAAEVTNKSDGHLDAFTSNGFTVGAGGDGDARINDDSHTYVAWNWKAGGSASNNTDGNTTTSVSVNQDAGFSIMKYAGDGNDSTIGHGLGAKPEYIIFKETDGAESWRVHSIYTPNNASNTLALNLADAAFSQSNWISAISNTTISIGTDSSFNTDGNNYIAYAFAPKQGYSKFGSYVGNGNVSGSYIHLGFKPAWVMVKKTTAANNWVMMDNKRDPFNMMTEYLLANDNTAEGTGLNFDFLSNGFKLKSASGGTNTSGATYIYMAFAENPLVTSTGVPATAR